MLIRGIASYNPYKWAIMELFLNIFNPLKPKEEREKRKWGE
jgi:hypothetical protein